MVWLFRLCYRRRGSLRGSGLLARAPGGPGVPMRARRFRPRNRFPDLRVPGLQMAQARGRGKRGASPEAGGVPELALRGTRGALHGPAARMLSHSWGAVILSLFRDLSKGGYATRGV